VLNLSILDGWFDEAYETSGGWAIGDREEYAEDQDAIHAKPGVDLTFFASSLKVA